MPDGLMPVCQLHLTEGLRLMGEPEKIEDPAAVAARMKAEILENQKRRHEAEMKKAREQENKRIESLKSLVPFKPKEEPKATKAEQSKTEGPKAKTIEETVQEIIADAGGEKKKEDDRPLIELGPKDSPRLINVVAGTMRHLASTGAQIFQRGGMLMRPVHERSFDSDGKPVKVVSLIRLDEGALQLILMQRLRWLRRTEGGTKGVNPMDTEVASLILKARGAWPFPPVSGLITAPTLRPDGSLLDEDGYDEQTGLLLFNSIPLSVKLKPSVADAEGALGLLKGLLVEVPFADIDKIDRSPSRSVALSLIISLAARGALETVPLHGATAPAIGAGKTYLVNIACFIVSGRRCAVIGATRDREELEKKIATSLLAGRQLISLDNVNGVRSSDLLSQVLSEGKFVHRLLGTNTEIEVASKSVFAATGNNLLIADDLIRRTLLISLETKEECAWDKEFRNEPLEMIARDRAKYISAALTIPLAYIAAGKPDLPRDLNGYQQWSQLVRGALMWLGEADPIETMRVVREHDPRLQASTSMLFAMRTAFGGSEYTAAEMVSLVDEKEIIDMKKFLGEPIEARSKQRALRDAMAGVCKDGKITTANLSYWLRSRNGQILSGLRLCGEADRTRLMHWRVVVEGRE
jgi:putative DNA primase/helicase